MTDLWIRRFQTDPAPGPRLVCFPYAGGAAGYFRPLAGELRQSADVLAVQYPGRQERRSEEPLRDLHTLADRVAAALSAHRDRPLVFFGHSMGAVVAHEVALRLAADGDGPVELFASGRRAPSRQRDDKVRLLDDDGLVRELKRLAGTDQAVLEDKEILDMVLPAIRGDYWAVETYRHRPGTMLACPVTVLVGDRDERVTLDEARAWREHTTGRFALESFGGGHFFINDHTKAIAELLRRRLSEISRHLSPAAHTVASGGDLPGR
ncbi:thioesterase II family protein [Streptomyces sp. NPDC058221]|uniref:thioesterase II family protein n=1 Tax=Streptomyces sp. NPDC058221 TaxID=3346388 RepID=UPI0036F1061A